MSGNDDGKDSGTPGEQTPLERYLAKQKQAKAAKHEMPKPTTRGWVKSTEPVAAKPTPPSRDPNEEKLLEVGVPLPPPPVDSGTRTRGFEPPPSEETLFEPGDMFPRMIAFMIDCVIISALTWPVQGIWLAVFNVFSSSTLEFTSGAIRFLSMYTVVFGYYGWFYTKKGASPGKLIVGLQVVDSADGSRLNYWRAFFREAVGKWISAVPLGIGFITAFFRDDRRALHDLLFDTAVVRGPSARNKT